jgi:3-(3-hydroxy-phenyl)propionate hydroxylase
VNASYDVCIVGCGPVGAAAALLLTREGLRVLVLERSPQVYDLPRAVFLDGESVRSFQRVGLAGDLVEVLQPPREGDAAWFTDSAHRQLFGIEMPAYGANGWRDGAFFDQPELERRLRDRIATEPGIELRLGEELVGFVEEEGGLALETARVVDGRRGAARAAWMIACDGASSFVRRRLGIAWQSLGYDGDWLVVDIVADDPAELPSVTMQVCDPKRLTTYICGKDPFRRWEFRLLPGETREEMSSPGRVAELLDPWIARGRYEIRRAAVYQFHAATAARWREGRIFLAGDAAHQTPPFLGQGLNAGWRDAVNLAWKLARVKVGDAEANLLETYEVERSAHAHELVDWAVAVGRLMDALADLEAGRLEGPPPDDLMRSGYGQGRTAPPLREGLVVEEQVSDAGVTGYLFGQPTVVDASGREAMFDEWLGRGFAVVGRDCAALAMSEASRAALARLGASVVDFSKVRVVGGERDRLFDRHAAAVVRPDRYVFGVTDDALCLDDLVARLERTWKGDARPAGKKNGSARREAGSPQGEAR